MADSFYTSEAKVIFKVPFVNLYIVKWKSEYYIAKKIDERYYFL